MIAVHQHRSNYSLQELFQAHEAAYHTPHHLMGLMQPINQQKSGCEAGQKPSHLWYAVIYVSLSGQSQTLDRDETDCYLFVYF